MREWIELTPVDLSRPLPPISIISGKPATVTVSDVAKFIPAGQQQRAPGGMFGLVGILIVALVSFVTGSGRRKEAEARSKDIQIELPMTAGERTRCRIQRVIKFIASTILFVSTPLLFYHGLWWAGQDGKQKIDTRGWPKVPGGVVVVGGATILGLFLLTLTYGSTHLRYLNRVVKVRADTAFIVALQATRPARMGAPGVATSGWAAQAPAAPPAWGAPTPPAPPAWGAPLPPPTSPTAPQWTPPARTSPAPPAAFPAAPPAAPPQWTPPPAAPPPWTPPPQQQ